MSFFALWCFWVIMPSERASVEAPDASPQPKDRATMLSPVRHRRSSLMAAPPHPGAWQSVTTG